MDMLFSGVSALMPDGSVLSPAYVGVRDGKIAYVGSEQPTEKAGRVIARPHMVLIPGLINAHTHLPMSLLRGFADDLNLQDWLFGHILPAETKLTDELVGVGTLLSLMECLAGGTTCVIDMYDHCDAMAEAVASAGVKANLSRGCVQPEGFSWPDSAAYHETAGLAERWHGHDRGLIRIDASVHAEYTSTGALWAPMAQLASEKGLRMHIHISETRREHEECRQRHGGKTPVQVLCEAGLWPHGGVAAHCVFIEEGDLALLAGRGVTAVHNPVSNFKLSSGVADIPAMLRGAVNVALGTDGVASNNNHDLFEELKFAAMAQLSPCAVTARDVLAMATQNGAAAAGRSNETGRIEVGLDADLVLLDFDKPHLTPCYSVSSHLVYTARGSDVRMTMVRGRVLYEDGEFPTIDRERVMDAARKAACIF